jgi:hypothetical protein
MRAQKSADVTRQPAQGPRRRQFADPPDAAPGDDIVHGVHVESGLFIWVSLQISTDDRAHTV